MRRLLTLLLVLAPTAVYAQTVPGPRVSVALDRPQGPSCESGGNLTDAWAMTYGTCYRPTTVAFGSPFLTHIRITFTGATTTSTLIPRAQVVIGSTTAVCGGTSTSCLRINDVPAPVGDSTITVRFVDGEGRDGTASAAIPFTGSGPAIPAATGLRALP